MMKLSAIEQSAWTGSLYTQLCFCYQTINDTTQSSAIETLTSGLERLTSSFPWIAGQVVIDEDGQSGFGSVKIAPFEPLPALIVKDLAVDPSMPSMDVLIKENFPFRHLDENLLCPRPTFPTDPHDKRPSPVLMLQANFITGGLLLTVNASHSAMDLVGQVQVIRLLSKACQRIDFTSEEISAGNLDRSNLIPLLDDSWQPDLPPTSTAATKPTTETISTPPPPQPDLDWSYFNLSPQSLNHLKSLTTSTVPSTNAVPFISTDDAICALLWKSLARARLNRPPSSPAPPTLSFRRIVEMRTQMSISPFYLGNMAAMTLTHATLASLTLTPLGVLASDLRSQLLQTDHLIHSVRATATTRARTKVPMPSSAHPKTSPPPLATQMSRPDILGISSWTKSTCHDVTFNLGLGPPVAVRRPRFTPIEGIVYLLPKTREGEIVMGVCLRKEDMEFLKADTAEGEGFARFVEFID